MIKRLKQKLHRRKESRERQRKLWEKYNEQGHAKAAKKDGRVMRFLRHLLSKKERERKRKAPKVMFDDTSVSLIPDGAPSVLCYTNGNFQTCKEVAAKFPNVPHLTTDVNATNPRARCLDVEPGDASPASCPQWFREHREHNPHEIPVFYGSIDTTIPQIKAALSSFRIRRNEYLLLSAHYTFQPHICGPKTCGFPTQCDGTQWTNRALGLSLDESLLSHEIFG